MEEAQLNLDIINTVILIMHVSQPDASAKCQFSLPGGPVKAYYHLLISSPLIGLSSSTEIYQESAKGGGKRGERQTYRERGGRKIEKERGERRRKERERKREKREERGERAGE